jgi:hypothetical protein
MSRLKSIYYIVDAPRIGKGELMQEDKKRVLYGKKG